MDLRELQKAYLDNLRQVTEEKLEKLMEGEYFGKLTEADLQGIFDILKTTETLTNKEKKRFGII